MSGGGNAKPLGCEKGPSSMLGSTSWQVFDQFSIFPDFHIRPRGGQNLSFFSYPKANKFKHWGFKTMFNDLHNDFLSYHFSVLYNVTASSTSDCILTPQKARICNRVLSLDMWSKYQQERSKKASIRVLLLQFHPSKSHNEIFSNKVGGHSHVESWVTRGPNPPFPHYTALKNICLTKSF